MVTKYYKKRNEKKISYLVSVFWCVFDANSSQLEEHWRRSKLYQLLFLRLLESQEKLVCRRSLGMNTKGALCLVVSRWRKVGVKKSGRFLLVRVLVFNLEISGNIRKAHKIIFNGFIFVKNYRLFVVSKQHFHNIIFRRKYFFSRVVLLKNISP